MYNDVPDGFQVKQAPTNYSDIPEGFEVADTQATDIPEGFQVKQNSDIPDGFVAQEQQAPTAQQEPVDAYTGESVQAPQEKDPLVKPQLVVDPSQQQTQQQEQPQEKSMVDLIGEKLNELGSGVKQGAKDAFPQLKQQLAGYMRTYEPKSKEDFDHSLDALAYKDYDQYLKSYKATNPLSSFIADKGKELAQQVNQTAPSKQKKGSLGYYAEQVTGSLLNMTPTLAVSILGRRPDLGLGLMYGQMKGGSYGTARDQGLDTKDARVYSNLTALAETIPETVPLGKLLKPTGKFIKDIGIDAFSETTQELLTSGLELGIDKGYINKDMTWGEALETLKDTAIVSAAAGTITGVATHKVASKMQERDQDKQLDQLMESRLPDAQDEAVNRLDADNAQLSKVVDNAPEVGEPKAKEPVKPKKDTSVEYSATIDKPVVEEQTKGSEKPTKHQVKGLEVVEAPIDEITVSKDVPQFKEGANEKGVVEPLGGKFERTGVAPIQVWARKDGRKEVISGRHRLDLAQRSGEKTIPAQYHYESKGFTTDKAAVLDSILNIREGQGKVKDYVDFIKATTPTKEEADAQGILARQTGKRAFTIATEGSDALITAHRNDQISDEAATRIAQVAPNNESLQAVGLKALQEGKTIAVSENMVKAVQSMTDESQQDGGDMFGFDDSAIVEAENMAKKAVKKQNEIQKTLSAVQGAAKRPELARKEGVDVKDPEAVKSRIAELKKEKSKWNNWHTDPNLVAELKGEAPKEEPEVISNKETTTEDVPEKDKFISHSGGDQVGVPHEEVFKRGDVAKVIKSVRGNKVEYFEAGRIEGISHAKEQAKMGGVWFDFDSFVRADESEIPKMPEPKKESVSSLIDKSNKKHAEGLTEEDRVPEPRTSYTENPAVAHGEFIKTIADETATPESIQENFRMVVNDKDAILEKLNSRQFTKNMLVKMSGTYRTDLKKSELAKLAYERMLSSHVLSSVTTIVFGGGKSYEQQIMDQVNNQTQSDIDNAYEERRLAKVRAKKQAEQYEKAITNPETLEDFRRFIAVNGKESMTAEQLASYDELVASSLRKEDKPPVITKIDQVKIERAQTKHTKTGEDLFVVKLAERVDKDKFRELSRKAKQFGGYYSSYSKGGAIAGFQFKTVEQADQFDDLLSGKDIDQSDFIEAKTEIKQANNAERLSNLAENIEAKALEDINKPRQTNTPRRASMASGAIRDAEKRLALAKTIKNISNKLQQGELVHLSKLSQVTQLEELIGIQNRAVPNDSYANQSYDGYAINRELKDGITVSDYITNVKYPSIDVSMDTIRSVADSLKGKRGYARLSAELRRVRPSNDLGTYGTLTKEQAEKIMEAKKKGIVDGYQLSWIPDKLASLKRLEKLDITTVEQLRAAIRELDSLRETARKEDPIKKIERDIVGKKIAGFFPTPDPLVSKLIDYADIKAGHDVLEPSAGKGNIADQIKTSTPDADLDVVEFNQSLSSILDLKGYNVVGSDFIKYKGKKYDRIVMNPPFENFQDIDHVKHAYDLLKPGGKLVAIMGAGVKNSRTKAIEFREWLDDRGSYIEDLPEGSFKNSERSTSVNTVMVVIEKPTEDIDIFKSSAGYNTGENYVAPFRQSGLPERSDSVLVGNKSVRLKKDVYRFEPIKAKMIDIIGRRLYEGRIKGKSDEGFYRPSIGEVRTKRKNDIEVLSHEMAHYLDFYSNTKLPNFKKLYKDPKYSEQVKALSYTDKNPQLQEIEGFAEFVRLYLTNSYEAELRAPDFYKAFEQTLRRDRKLYNKMKSLQVDLHRYFNQGIDAITRSKIGKNVPFKAKFEQYSYRRASLIRQQTIDMFHAGYIIDKEINKGVSDSVENSVYKMLRTANSAVDSMSDHILKYGTLGFNEKGEIVKTGDGLYSVFSPVEKIKLKPEHKGEQRIDLLMRYFAGRRAIELQKQGRENLFSKEEAMHMAKLGKDYPIFEKIHKEYQEFNGRMLDFMQQAGLFNADARKKIEEMNKDYVPFFRVRDKLSGGKGQSATLTRLRGGTANVSDILENIQDGVVSNVRAALDNRAKQLLYKSLSHNKDGALFAVRIAPDSKLVKDYTGEIKSKIEAVLDEAGITTKLDDDLFQFWQHGIKPSAGASGNVIDSVMINGKPRYYEVQDPLLQNMLLSMNPSSYGQFMNGMMFVKNFFTRSITLGVEFAGANLVRDMTTAVMLTKNPMIKFNGLKPTFNLKGYIPFISNLQGFYAYLSKNKTFQDFMAGGSGYSSTSHSLTSSEKAAKYRMGYGKIRDMKPQDFPGRLMSLVDYMTGAFEYSTRIGEFAASRRNGKSLLSAGYDAREISTDFAIHGSNEFTTGFMRTVPFMNAAVQSIDRTYKEIIRKKKYGGNTLGFAARGILGVTIPSIMLWLVNHDDEDYKQIPKVLRDTNWFFKLDKDYYVKVPKPYDVGMVFATLPENFMQYMEDKNGKKFTESMAWAMVQMFGINGVPAMAQGWLDLTTNKKWTGAPIVPGSLQGASAPNQYNSSTGETFIQLGKMLNVSPMKAQYIFESYTGYLGGYVTDLSDKMLWDKDKFGEKTEEDWSRSPFYTRFVYKNTRPSTQYMTDFFNLKEEAEQVMADFNLGKDVTRSVMGKQDGQFRDDNGLFGRTKKEKMVLYKLNTAMNRVNKFIYGNKGMRTQEIAISRDKNLTGKQKRDKIELLWKRKADIYKRFMTVANDALERAKKMSQENK